MSKEAVVSSTLKTYVADYLQLWEKTQHMKSELKDIQDELHIVEDNLQKELDQSELDCLQIPGAGTFSAKETERSSVVTVAQRDECIRSFFATPSKFDPHLSPEVLANRLIDSFQDLKTKTVSRKLHWKPEKK